MKDDRVLKHIHNPPNSDAKLASPPFNQIFGGLWICSKDILSLSPYKVPNGGNLMKQYKSFLRYFCSIVNQKN